MTGGLNMFYLDQTSPKPMNEDTQKNTVTKPNAWHPKEKRGDKQNDERGTLHIRLQIYSVQSRGTLYQYKNH